MSQTLRVLMIEDDAGNARPQALHGRVLVVDDTPANLQLARFILEPHGYTAVLAYSVAEALEAARREPPDLILSDIHMPGGDGFDLLAALRADPALHEIPFAFISASDWGGTDQTRAVAEGAQAFLQRPISSKDLLSEVQSLIEKSRRGHHRQKQSSG